MDISKNKIKYNNINYKNVSEYLIFTDIGMTQCDESYSIDHQIMFVNMKKSENPFAELISKIPIEIFEDTAKVRKVLLFFSMTDPTKYVRDDVRSALKKCGGLFSEASITIVVTDVNEFLYLLQDDWNKPTLTYPHMNIVNHPQSDFMNSDDFRNFIDHIFLEKFTVIDFNECQQFTTNQLQKKFKAWKLSNFFIFGDPNVDSDWARLLKFFDGSPLFAIKYIGDSSYSLSVFYVSQFSVSHEIICFKNHHLISLHSFEYLSKLIDCLNSLRKTVKLRIEYGNVVLDENPNYLKNTIILKDLLKKLDDIPSSKKFKIQLHHSNVLIFNRVLKISFPILKVLLDNNKIEDFIDLAFLYFNCFSIAPVCCRMQSLALEATVYDFEKHSYLHLQKHLSKYKKLCKILYSNIDVDDELFNKTYFEVIPVTLIGRFRGKKLEEFIAKLECLKKMQEIVPLKNGKFRIGRYFEVTAEILAKLSDFDQLKQCSDMLAGCIIIDPIKLSIVRATENQQFLGFKCKDHDPAFDENVKEALKYLSGMFNMELKPQIFPSHYSFLTITKPHSDNIVISHFYNGYNKIWQQCYNDEKFWVYKERFFFASLYPFESICNIVEGLLSFEQSEGIFLAFIKNKIVKVENMNASIAELDPDAYKATADYCYYEDFSKIFTKLIEYFASVDTPKDLYYEITNNGTVKFYSSIEIYPSTLLQIKNVPSLLIIIKKLSRLIGADAHKTYPLANNSRHKDWDTTENLLPPLAKLFNPLLNDYPSQDLSKLRLTAIPWMFYQLINREEISDAFEKIRNSRINITVSPIEEQFFLDCVGANALPLINANIERILEIVEEINADFDGCLILDQRFRNIDYEQCEKRKFSTSEYFPTDLTKENVEKCLQIFKENLDKINSVSITSNRYFCLNTTLYISAEDILKLTPNNVKLFFEALEILTKNRQHENVFLSDHVISFGDNDDIKQRLQTNTKFKQLNVLSENKEIYLELASLINGCLQELSSEILNQEWFKIIPRQMVIQKEDATKLLQIFRKVKEKGYNIEFDYASNFKTLYVSLPITKWLNIVRADNFFSLMAWFVILNTFKTNEKKFCLFFSGLLSYNFHEEETPVTAKIMENQKMMETTVMYCLTQMKKQNHYFPITINSGINLMIGEFIWIFVDEVQFVLFDILRIGVWYILSINETETDRMKSIHELSKKDLQNKENAIRLAKIMNKNLQNISDELICDKNLRIFPTQLWNACNENAENYTKFMSVFERLTENGISWFLKLNGNFELSSRIVVTATELLYFWENKEKVNLIPEIMNIARQNLICENEIVYQQQSYKKKYETNMQFFKNNEAAKKYLKKHNILYRIESNGGLRINDNLRLSPSDVSKEEESSAVEVSKKLSSSDVPEESAITVSKTLSNVFPTTKFLYGNSGVYYLTSLLTSTNEMIYDYCYNMCKYIVENYPDINITYFPETDLFKFKDLLSIHPRSFFHFQSIDAVIKILRRFDQHLKKNPQILKNGTKLSEEEIQFCIDLWEIKKDERVEFEEMRTYFYEELMSIILDNIEKLKVLGISTDVLRSPLLYFGIRDIKIQNIAIFETGSINGFFQIKKGIISMKFDKQHIIEAFEFSKNLEEKHQCRNISDFLSVIEILNGYDSFFKNRKKENCISELEKIESKTRHEQIYWWLEEVEQIQSMSWDYKFFNALKGLHHWIKHYQTFKNLEEYYAKLNQFFKTATYTHELNTQNGDFISRNYADSQYFGVYGIPYDTSRSPCVITFWFEKKKEKLVEKKKLGFDAACTPTKKYLIYSDKDFKGFFSEESTKLHDDIVVLTINSSKPQNLNFSYLNQFVNLSKSKKNMKNIEKVVLFLPSIVEHKTKKNTENEKNFNYEEYEESFDKVMKTLKAIFNDIYIVLCYPHNIDVKKLDILTKHQSNYKFQLMVIEETLLISNDSFQLKEFIESVLKLTK